MSMRFDFQNLDYALDIYAGTVLVARLGFEPQTDTYQLQYAESWTNSPKGYALSPHLPLDNTSNSATLRRFLENLLPEGRALDITCSFNNIQKNNVFALIRQLGKETTGGLTFLPAGQAPKALKAVCREISLSELQERIDDRNQIPFTIWDGKVRASVAGFQDKLMVHLHAGRLFLVDGSLSSTHIIKPESTHATMPCMVANEHFCMKLAERISLARYKQSNVAHVDILRVPSPVLSVRRFDRQARHEAQEVELIDAKGQATGKTVHIDLMNRLHIIDGCQAVDAPVSFKYERNFGNGADVAHIRDGVGFASIFKCKKYLEVPAIGTQRLILWAATTLLFGNSDAHGKNISFQVDRAGLRVAELYDLVSVMQYDSNKLEHSLAMAFGDAFELGNVKSFNLAYFCVRCDINRAFFARELVNLCKIALVEAPLQAQDAIYEGEEKAMVSAIAGFVVQQANELLSLTSEIQRYKEDLF
jgi:serine/threonine-protein kinase HipA